MLCMLLPLPWAVEHLLIVKMQSFAVRASSPHSRSPRYSGEPDAEPAPVAAESDLRAQRAWPYVAGGVGYGALLGGAALFHLRRNGRSSRCRRHPSVANFQPGQPARTLGQLIFESLRNRGTVAERRDSQIWHYQGKQGRAEFCLDYPFKEWHVLEHCYEGLGWRVRTKSITEDAGEPPTVDIDLATSLGANALLLYQLFDENGTPVDDGIWGRLEQCLASSLRLHRPAPTIYQIQLFLEWDERPSVEEQQQAKAFFKHAAAELRKRITESSVANEVAFQ